MTLGHLGIRLVAQSSAAARVPPAWHHIKHIKKYTQDPALAPRHYCLIDLYSLETGLWCATPCHANGGLQCVKGYNIYNFQSYNSILHLRSLSQSRIGLDSIACCISKGRVWSWSAWFWASWLSLIHRGGFARYNKINKYVVQQTMPNCLTNLNHSSAKKGADSMLVLNILNARRDLGHTRAISTTSWAPERSLSVHRANISSKVPMSTTTSWETTKKISEIIWIHVNSWRIKNSHTFQIQKG